MQKDYILVKQLLNYLLKRKDWNQIKNNFLEELKIEIVFDNDDKIYYYDESLKNENLLFSGIRVIIINIFKYPK